MFDKHQATPDRCKVLLDQDLAIEHGVVEVVLDDHFQKIDRQLDIGAAFGVRVLAQAHHGFWADGQAAVLLRCAQADACLRTANLEGAEVAAKLFGNRRRSHTIRDHGWNVSHDLLGQNCRSSGHFAVRVCAA